MDSRHEFPYVLLWPWVNSFGVFYAVIALNQRPYFNEMNKVIVFTLLLAIPIYFINIVLGEPATFGI